MTQAGVKAFVTFIQQGHQPEDYQPQGGKDQESQNQPAPGKLKGAISAGLAGMARLVRGPQAKGQALAVPGQGAKPQNGPGPIASKASAKLGTGGKGKTKGGRKASKAGVLSSVFSTMAHSLGRYLAQGLVWILLVVLGLAGLHFAQSRFRGWRLVAPATASIPQSQAAAVSLSNPTQNSKLNTQNSPEVASARAPESSPQWTDPESKVPDELRQREKDDKQRALKLWGLFWAIAYKHDIDYWRYDIGDHFSKECSDDFDTAYFNDDLQDGIQKEKLYYKTGQPDAPKLLDSSDTTMTIEVDGPVTQLGDAVYKGKVFWKNRMALVVAFQHGPDGNWTVTKIESKPAGGKKAPAKTPAKAGAAAKGKDVLQQVGEGVKDVQGAVSTATGVKSAADKAKGLLGF